MCHCATLLLGQLRSIPTWRFMLVWSTGMYMFNLNRRTESVDSMGDYTADSYETFIFQCLIPMGDLLIKNIISAWSWI